MTNETQTDQVDETAQGSRLPDDSPKHATHQVALALANLAEAVQIAKRVAGANTRIGTYGMILLVSEHATDPAQPGWLTIVARDTDKEMRITIPAMVTGNADQAAVFVYAGPLAELLATLGDSDQVALTIRRTSLQVAARDGRNVSNLCGTEAEAGYLLPAIPDPEGTRHSVLTVPGLALARMIGNVEPAAASRPGVAKGGPMSDLLHLRITPASAGQAAALAITATNGYVLATDRLPVAEAQTDAAALAFIADRATMSVVQRLAEGLPEATIVIGEKAIRFDLGATTLYARAGAATYPDMDQHVARARARRRLANVVADQPALAAAVKLAAKVSASGFMRLALPAPDGDQGMTIEAWGEEMEADQPVPSQVAWDLHAPDAQTVTLMPGLIAPFLADAGKLTIDVHGPTEALFLGDTNRPEWFAMVMPARPVERP